jgi:hypothetical protein
MWVFQITEENGSIVKPIHDVRDDRKSTSLCVKEHSPQPTVLLFTRVFVYDFVLITLFNFVLVASLFPSLSKQESESKECI